MMWEMLISISVLYVIILLLNNKLFHLQSDVELRFKDLQYQTRERCKEIENNLNNMKCESIYSNYDIGLIKKDLSTISKSLEENKDV